MDRFAILLAGRVSATLDLRAAGPVDAIADRAAGAN